LAEELKELTGIDIQLVQNGIFKIAKTDAEAASLASIISIQKKLGESASWIAPNELREWEPSLSECIKGAMYIPNDGNVSPPNLSRALAHAAIGLGAEMMEHTEVCGFIKETNRIIGVQTMIDKIFADETVITGGAWSEQLLSQLGIKLNTYPVKGECFSVRVKKSPVIRTIFSKGCYIVPKPDGRLVIGATEEANTFDESVHLEGLVQLMQRAIKLIPELTCAQWEKSWAGIRPQTADKTPYMGRHPLFEGLSIATGHYRNGILLAPITGLNMAKLLEGEEIEAPF